MYDDNDDNLYRTSSNRISIRGRRTIMDDIIVVDHIYTWAIEEGDFIRLPDGTDVIVKRVEESVLDNHYSIIYMNEFGDDEESFSLDQDEMVALLQFA